MRGNVFSYADIALYAHAGFNVDWGGNDGTGMQTGRGHRMAIMSIDGDYTNVGLAAVPESERPPPQVGPLVVTGNYAYAATSLRRSLQPLPGRHGVGGSRRRRSLRRGRGLRRRARSCRASVPTTPSRARRAATRSRCPRRSTRASSPCRSPAAASIRETKVVDVGSESELLDYLVGDDSPHRSRGLSRTASPRCSRSLRCERSPQARGGVDSRTS